MRIRLRQEDLPEGAVLRRWYGGELIEVRVGKVRAGGIQGRKRRRWRYEWRGEVYSTLSAITREVTGNYTLSGNRFFGLWPRTGRFGGDDDVDER